MLHFLYGRRFGTYAELPNSAESSISSRHAHMLNPMNSNSFSSIQTSPQISTDAAPDDSLQRDPKSGGKFLWFPDYVTSVFYPFPEQMQFGIGK